MVDIPEVILTIGSRAMPLIGMGTAAHPFTPENTKRAIIDAIEIGYRHFDTASLYGSEEPLGEAIMEAQKLGLIKSRDELFITSKLWCHEAHPHLVLPAINKSLRNLKMEYLDLYLIHMPISSKPEPGKSPFPVDKDDIVPMDMKSVWEAMEECQRLGLTRAIGVSNFTEKKLDLLLATAKIPPQVNQVEMNPTWQQIKLREYCKEKGIHVTAYSPLGGQSADKNLVMESEVMKEIANSQGKTVAQVSLRWVHEQGVSMVVKSFNKERIKKNLEIFGWELTKEEQHKISQIPQCKKVNIELVVSNRGTWKPHPDDEL